MQHMMEIDNIDRRILRTLEDNGRIPNVELANLVGLSPSACLRRVQELERKKIITGYRAVVDRSKLGVGAVIFVMIGLSGHSKKDAQAFEAAMDSAPEVSECHDVTGAIEYLLRVEVADLVAYKSFHSDTLGTLPQVKSITSYINLGSSKDLRA